MSATCSSARRPKDFDIGTSAPPHQIKRAFRNCWIIGRRFRLAHVKFGPKTIEVATFRRNVRADETDAGSAAELGETNGNQATSPGDLVIHRDNTYGTPEEDAFRRDFTMNGLFYDSSRRTIIDFVGGLDNLRERVVRSIGDPRSASRRTRCGCFAPSPWRSACGFTLDADVERAIDQLGLAHPLQRARARLMEEYFKLLRSGAAEASFQGLARAGLIEHISPEMEEGLSEEFFDSLERLDAFRKRFAEVPARLTSTILVGALLVPLGLMDTAHRRYGVSEQWYPALGRLPVPRKDVERLEQVLALLPKLQDTDAPSRAQHALIARGMFSDALTWLEVFGDDLRVVRHWQEVLQQPEIAAAARVPGAGPAGEGADAERRRRRRRRRRGPITSPA